MSNKKGSKAVFAEDDQRLEKESEVSEEPKAEEKIKAPSADANILYLPSEGRLGYPDHVEYRDIMAGDEEVLAGATQDTYVKTLNGVLKSVLNDCEFFEQLTLADRDYCLIWLWSNNYSRHKTLETRCGACGNEQKHKVDMLNLPYDKLSEKIKTPFELEVKKTGKPIFIRLNTVEDEIWANNYVNDKKHGKNKPMFENVMLWRSIDIGVELPFEQKVNWIKTNVTGREMGIIRQFHTYFKYGVDTTLEFECSSCGEVTRGELPFQIEDVLYPTVSTDFEDFL